MSALKSLILFLILMISSGISLAQDEKKDPKNGISFDLTQMATNELNMSYTRYVSERKSLEFAAGLIYVNEILEELSKDWSTTRYFSEHGFSARIAYKMYKKPVDDSKWRDYIAPAIMYKYLYYNNQWLENEKTDSRTGTKFIECIYQHRFRSKYGLEFLWGKEYHFNRTFVLEMFYGIGLRGTSVLRADILKQDICDSTEIRRLDFEDTRFYVRPALRAGVKMRIAF
ncbi:MAG: hypothetical protein DWQ44_04525 [Bacteroidetes bacterium]|nr:MAG: hypothetical protein DWQ33_11265 [Bacteroidota bacterium]REK00664.1 MAG: hypothetical protein DWQ39_10940 [Bacteroidota bacterium]REK35214.1 MAG: hypothetical protein DWQ44_04525 [Bacteroidota bacterium]REK48291.1 MAG: hypothetical protein DWQ48_10725 [Bacteroidota bacterium]